MRRTAACRAAGRVRPGPVATREPVTARSPSPRAVTRTRLPLCPRVPSSVPSPAPSCASRRAPACPHLHTSHTRSPHLPSCASRRTHAYPGQRASFAHLPSHTLACRVPRNTGKFQEAGSWAMSVGGSGHLALSTSCSVCWARGTGRTEGSRAVGGASSVVADAWTTGASWGGGRAVPTECASPACVCRLPPGEPCRCSRSGCACTWVVGFHAGLELGCCVLSWEVGSTGPRTSWGQTRGLVQSLGGVGLRQAV